MRLEERLQKLAAEQGEVFGEGQMLPHLPGKTDLPQEGDEAGQPAEGRDGLGSFAQNQLGRTKERGDFRAGHFVQGRQG